MGKREYYFFNLASRRVKALRSQSCLSNSPEGFSIRSLAMEIAGFFLFFQSIYLFSIDYKSPFFLPESLGWQGLATVCFVRVGQKVCF
jgi:hypothetical protein